MLCRAARDDLASGGQGVVGRVVAGLEFGTGFQEPVQLVPVHVHGVDALLEVPARHVDRDHRLDSTVLEESPLVLGQTAQKFVQGQDGQVVLGGA